MPEPTEFENWDSGLSNRSDWASPLLWYFFIIGVGGFVLFPNLVDPFGPIWGYILAALITAFAASKTIYDKAKIDLWRDHLDEKRKRHSALMCVYYDLYHILAFLEININAYSRLDWSNGPHSIKSLKLNVEHLLGLDYETKGYLPLKIASSIELIRSTVQMYNDLTDDDKYDGLKENHVLADTIRILAEPVVRTCESILESQANLSEEEKKQENQKVETRYQSIRDVLQQIKSS